MLTGCNVFDMIKVPFCRKTGNAAPLRRKVRITPLL